MKGSYVITGVVAAASIIGFAGYKQMEANKANDSQLLVATSESPGSSKPGSANLETGLPPGSSIGDGNQAPPTGNFNGGAPNTRMNRGEFGRGPGSSQPDERRRNQGNGEPMRAPQSGGGNSDRPVQPRGGNGGQMPNMSADDAIFSMGSMILGDPKVLTELKLDSGQKEAIAQAMRPPQTSQGDEQNPEAAVQNMMSAGAERGKKVKAILNDSQEKRFTQLVYQSFGPSAMMQPNLIEKFGLSESEMQKMQQAAQTFMQEQMKNMQGGNFDLDAIAKQKVNLDKKMLEVLDDDSKAKWRAAIGAPFTFSSPMGLGGAFGGGRPMGGVRGGQRRGGV